LLPVVDHSGVLLIAFDGRGLIAPFCAGGFESLCLWSLKSEREWTTVRLWDNADVVDEHHEHEYTRAGGKQAPDILEFSSSNEAMAAAIRKAKTETPAIVRQWRES
jgi:hypothetical protein